MQQTTLKTAPLGDTGLEITRVGFGRAPVEASRRMMVVTVHTTSQGRTCPPFAFLRVFAS